MSTPTEEFIKKTTAEITDSLGRKITVTKPAPLARFRFIEALGKSADIETYVQMMSPLLFVTAIDGDSNIAKSTKLHLEALVNRLGDEGIEAVIKGINENFAEVVNPTETKEEIKK